MFRSKRQAFVPGGRNVINRATAGPLPRGVRRLFRHTGALEAKHLGHQTQR